MAENGDMQAHEQTYDGFLGMLKMGTIATIVVVAAVVALIASGARTA